MPKYRNGDFLTLEQAAEETGYTPAYLTSLLAPSNYNYDPMLTRIRIKTDPTFRRAFNTTAHYVFQYRDLMAWFNDRQSRSSIQHWNESHGIIVD